MANGQAFSKTRKSVIPDAKNSLEKFNKNTIEIDRKIEAGKRFKKRIANLAQSFNSETVDNHSYEAT